MTKTELDVIKRLIGCKIMGIRSSGTGTLRDVQGGLVHRVCMKLEEEGVGICEDLGRGNFRFSTHQAITERERKMAMADRKVS